MALAARAADQPAELVDARLVLDHPMLDSGVDRLAAAAAEEVDAELLEIAGEARGQKPLPLIAGDKAGDLLLRPIEPERFAEASVGAGRFELVEVLARGERGDAEDAVELIKANKNPHDVVACTERDQSIAPRDGFVAHLGADELGCRRRDLAHAGLEQSAELVDPRLASARAEHVGDMRPNARRSDREELDADRRGKLVLFDRRP